MRKQQEQGWKRLTALFDGHDHAKKRLLEALQRDYQEERALSQLLEQESVRVPYSHLRKKLLDIASRERIHAELLAAKIRDLGGELPEQASQLREKRNQQTFTTTMQLLDLLSEEKKEYIEYLQSARLAKEAGEKGLNNLLRQIAEEERRHRQELLDVITRLNPL